MLTGPKITTITFQEQDEFFQKKFNDVCITIFGGWKFRADASAKTTPEKVFGVFKNNIPDMPITVEKLNSSIEKGELKDVLGHQLMAYVLAHFLHMAKKGVAFDYLNCNFTINFKMGACKEKPTLGQEIFKFLYNFANNEGMFTTHNLEITFKPIEK